VHQWLANRGYAVLSVNFRGSTGFGKDFISAGDLEWGAKMHDDLIDATDWAIAQGIAEADKVAIMGGSYGGYATLAGLTFTPEKFACGVDIVGPSNLETLLETIPPYWEPLVKQFHERMGNPNTPEGLALLKERSPLYKAGEIVKPLLIGQGANDPRVKQSESDQIVGAMKEAGIPVTYVLYPDEGHGFAKPANSIAFMAVAENFLSTCVGGRAEPIGDALEPSTAEIVEGADFVSGLAEAPSG
jgi:dipeptidyl aminopeptidase/acylaminoacyl peptidase